MLQCGALVSIDKQAHLKAFVSKLILIYHCSSAQRVDYHLPANCSISYDDRCIRGCIPRHEFSELNRFDFEHQRRSSFPVSIASPLLQALIDRVRNSGKLFLDVEGHSGQCVTLTSVASHWPCADHPMAIVMTNSKASKKDWKALRDRSSAASHHSAILELVRQSGRITPLPAACLSCRIG